MTSDDKTREYVLLRYFRDLTLLTRWTLLKMDFDAIEKIDANTWFNKFEGTSAEEGKRLAKRMIQFEIIAKIIILIEDLAILAESRLRNTNYYELLDKKKTIDKGNCTKSDLEEDVGLITKNFYSKLDSLSDDEICRIVSYSKPEKFNFDKDCISLLKVCIERDIKEIRRILKIIGDFGKEHHPVFRRYKHAGFPMLPEFPIINELPDYLKKFDFLSSVPVNQEDPFKEPKIIPFSKDVLEGYSIIATGLDRLLGDIAKNRIVCIQKNLDCIPSVGYFSGQTFTVEEHEKLMKKLEQFNVDFPSNNTSFNFGVDNHFAKSDSWYEKLPDFLHESRQRTKIDKEYNEKLRNT